MKETFKVSVINTRTQSRNNFNSTASTLAELKHDMDAAGIDYDGMTFMEGSTKTELKTDDSVLPVNVPVKRNGVATGETTNDLVFFLTSPEKHISSGSDRSDAYEYLREHPDLAETVREDTGRHYTNLPTADLVAYVSTAKAAEAKKAAKKATSKPAEKSVKPSIIDNIKKFVSDLFQKGVLTDTNAEAFNDILDGKDAPKVDCGYSQADINEMYGDWIKK